MVLDDKEGSSSVQQVVWTPGRLSKCNEPYSGRKELTHSKTTLTLYATQSRRSVWLEEQECTSHLGAKLLQGKQRSLLARKESPRGRSAIWDWTRSPSPYEREEGHTVTIGTVPLRAMFDLAARPT